MLTDVIINFKNSLLTTYFSPLGRVLASQKEGIVFCSYTNTTEVLKLCRGI